MRWLPGSLATPTRQPLGAARANVGSPLAPRNGFVWVPNTDATRGRLLAFGGTGADPVLRAMPNGVGLYTNAKWVQSAQPSVAFSVMSFVAVITPTAAPVGGNFSAFLQTGQITLNWNHNSAGYQGSLTLYNNAAFPPCRFVNGFTAGQRVVIAGTYDGATVRVYRNGVLENSTTTANGLSGVTLNSLQFLGGTGGTAPWDGTCEFMYWDEGRALTAAEIAIVSRNAWAQFEQPARPLWAPASTITVYRPGSDVIVNGWTSTPSGSLASCIDDPTLDRADFITSPNLTDPATLTWASSLPAGSYSISVDADRLGASGQVRIVCLDSGGTSVGATSWQALTATATTYSLSVTTTGTSTQFRIEVQA